jgi:phosphatidylethanolamine-binding protein (PEBP) family uncharacterized protein
MKKDIFLMIFLFITFTGSLTASVLAEEYKPVANLAKLEISFADAEWGGKSIHYTQRCGSPDASTPRLIVKNIPAGTNAIIMEYSDRDWPDMDNVGHGKIGYHIPERTTEITIPSVPANTFDLPEGFFLVAAHQGGHFKAGAYMPPCSGGMGNRYYVTVKAVFTASPESKEFKVLGQAVLELGKF